MSMVLYGPGGRVDLSMQVYGFGSAPDNQFVLNDLNISPRHAVLQLQEQGYALIDLGSASGTYLNDQKLVPNVPVVLQNGAKFRMSNALYIYEVSQPAFPVSGSLLDESTLLESPVPTYEQVSSPVYPLLAEAQPLELHRP